MLALSGGHWRVQAVSGSVHLSGENFQARGSAMVLASLLLGLLLLPAPWRGECEVPKVCC